MSTPTNSADRRIRAEQLVRLLDGMLRFVQGTRPARSWPRRRAWTARAHGVADACKLVAVRALRREQALAAEFGSTKRAVRGLPTWLAASVTVLLMVAGLFTLHAILAVADVPELESWLLPAAFGPVFVMSTKILMGYWLGLFEDDRRAGRAAVRMLIPVLVLAFIAATAGVAIKAMVIGTLTPISDQSAMLSSAVMFGSIVLMEGVGAAALAARQHAPGASTYETVRSEYRQARRRSDKAVTRAYRADVVARSRSAWMTGWQEWAAGRGAMGSAYGWHRAAMITDDHDALLETVVVEPVRIGAVPAGFVPVPDPGLPVAVASFGAPMSSADLDAELRRLVEDREPDDDQDPLW